MRIHMHIQQHYLSKYHHYQSQLLQYCMYLHALFSSGLFEMQVSDFLFAWRDSVFTEFVEWFGAMNTMAKYRYYDIA